MKDFDIVISFELNIHPRVPVKTTLESIKIHQCETYLKANVHKLINALEEKLNQEFDMDNYESYGIKAIDIKKSK